MNQDDTNNQNPDREMQMWIEPELEARMVAWVAGEASAFEAAELERLVAEKPELAIFKRRIEAVQGLVSEALRPDTQPLQLSAERRAKLLATIGAPQPGTRDETIAVLPDAKRAPWWSWRGPQVYFAASGLAAALLIVVFIAPEQFVAYKQASMLRETAQPEHRISQPLSETAEASVVREQEPVHFAPLIATPTPPAPDLSNKPSAPVPLAASRTLEPIVKLDAFTVTESRDTGYSVSANSAAPIPPPITVPGLSDDLVMKDKRAAGIVDAAGSASAGNDATRANSASGQRASTVATDLNKQTPPSPDAGGLSLRSAGSLPLQSSPPSESIRVGNLEPAAARARADADQLFRPNPFAVPDAVNEKKAATATGAFADRVSQFGSTLSSASSPPPSATFGEPGAKALSGVTGAAGSVVLGASAGATPANTPAAPADQVYELSPFTVKAEKKGAARAARGVEGPVALAKRGAAKEEQEKAARDLPLRPVAPGSDEVAAAREPASTFSLHVSDVSFRLAVAAVAGLERGEQPRSLSVRAEEFYNAFDYGDPATAVNEKISARIEQSVHPVLQQRNLLRIALKVPSAGRGAGQPLRLTVLLDTSGSMEREDRRLAVRRALEELVALLGPDDRVTLIGFARQARLLAESVPGNQAGQLVELSARTPAEGGTNLEEALKLAGQLALRHKLDTAQNRIVLLTDGAANLGNADPARLTQSVETLRQQGIAFDACGIGLEGVGDVVLEALTRKGDGRYYVVDRPEAADAAFARQLAGAFRPAARNVKLQVRFNPSRVGQYRLIGFEQHRLREEDFRNDRVDAAELAADEGANAVYQVEVLPQGSGELGEVFVRFLDPSSGEMVERSWTIRYDPQPSRFDRASPSLKLAGVAALLAEKLNETLLAAQFKLGDLSAVVTAIRAHYPHEPRVQELVAMYGRMRRYTGE